MSVDGGPEPAARAVPRGRPRSCTPGSPVRSPRATHDRDRHPRRRAVGHGRPRPARRGARRPACEVVAPDNPSYLAYAYAPVMYGRSTSALHDTPLIDYAGSTPLAGGSVRLSYTVVWSHEDAGTGFVPFLRARLVGAADRHRERHLLHRGARRHRSATPATCGVGCRPATPTPRARPARPTWPSPAPTGATTPILRDATGNNDFSDQGTTGFRFQQAPVAPPGGRASPARR